MATGTAGTTARDLKMPVSHVISYDLAYNTTGASSGVKIGTLPANAVIHAWRVIIETAFNAGTTNPITIGTTATGAEVAASASITSATPGVYTGSAAAASGWKKQTADTALYVAYIPTGTAATTGVARVHITYANEDNG